MNSLITNKLFVLVSALIAGAILPFAFAPYEVRLVAAISPAYLLWLWLHIPRKHIYLSGLSFQIGFFAVGVNWVYNSIHLFGNAVAPLAIFVTALFVVALALLVSIGAWGYERLTRGHGAVVSVITFAIVWSLGEWIRGWLFGGFPWLSIGYSQVDTWFGGFAPVLGVYGTGLLLLLTVGFFVGAICESKISKRISLFVGVIIIVGGANVLDRVIWGEDKNTTLMVRMVQGNVKQQLKFNRDELKSSMDLYSDLSRLPGAEKLDVVIWPETAIPTFFSRVDSYLSPFVEEMRLEDTDVLSGGFSVNDRKHVFNAFRNLSSPDDTYLKSHLVPFGEFMPMRFLLEWLDKLIVIPMSDITAGPMIQPAITVKNEKLGISICFEDVFGEEMRFQLPGVGILVNVSNDTWFGDSAAPYQHQEIAAMRAREFARPLVRVTNTGVSSYISEKGEVLDSIAQFEQGVLDRRVTPRTGQTPFVWLGNYPLISIFGLFFMMMAWQKQSRKRDID